MEQYQLSVCIDDKIYEYIRQGRLDWAKYCLLERYPVITNKRLNRYMQRYENLINLEKSILAIDSNWSP